MNARGSIRRQLPWIAAIGLAAATPAYAGTADAGAIPGDPPAPSSPPEASPARPAWWTGSLLSASANTMPVGHWLVEPYVVFDRTAAAFDGNGDRHATRRLTRTSTAAYVMYGLAEGVSIGMQPRIRLGASLADGESAGAALGDLTLMLQVRLTHPPAGHWLPTTSLVLSETVPTGRYDGLGPDADTGTGGGTHRTELGFYAQSVGDVADGLPLRLRLNLTVGASDHTAIRDRSVYGTEDGFRGRARPGTWLLADFAMELSVTPHWVLALDLVRDTEARTVATGTPAPGASPIRIVSGPSQGWSVAPAVEYNFNERIGVIAGVRKTVAGHDTGAGRAVAVALNMVF
jgi:hypothetical protein